MFEDLLRDIQGTFAERFLKVQVNIQGPPAPPPPPPPPPASTDPTDDLFSSPRPVAPSAARGLPASAPGPRVQATDARGRAMQPGAATADPAAPTIGRNDPCPCGSGKKYKKCHGANA
jgi:preprotein translocase subunit SecA